MTALFALIAAAGILCGMVLAFTLDWLDAHL